MSARNDLTKYMYVLLNSLCKEIQLTSTSIHIYTGSGDKFCPIVATELGITCWIPTHFTILHKDEAISHIAEAKMNLLCVNIICPVHIVSSCQFIPGKVFLSATKNYFGLMPSPTNTYWNTYVFIHRHIVEVICKCT